MILVIKISDLSTFHTVNDLPVYDVFGQFDAAQYKIIMSDTHRFYDVGESWTFGLSATKTICKKSYQTRADYLMNLYVGAVTFIRAHRFADLYERKAGGGTWNVRETSEVTTFCGSSTPSVITAKYNAIMPGIQWKEAVYAETARLIGLVNSASSVEAIFALTENYPAYPNGK